MLLAQQRPFVERVEVARVLVDARVLDDAGRPVRGLEPADFEVRIDGTPARVESVEWISGGGVPDDSVPSAPEIGPIGLAPRGRLILFLVQKSLSASGAAAARDAGLMKVLRLTEPLLAELTPADRVAVLSFDSHLKIWTDFTSDVERIRRLLGEDVLLERPGPIVASADVSLLSGISRARGEKAYTMEEALGLIGRALEPLPGAKTIVLLGYGFGRPVRGGMGAALLEEGYDDASAALLAARAAVVSLDITDADFHSLEVSLQTVSVDTGGLFLRTNQFPQQAIRRVANALSGHYVLSVEKPETEPGTHRIAVRLVQGGGSVFARSAYVE